MTGVITPPGKLLFSPNHDTYVDQLMLNHDMNRERAEETAFENLARYQSFRLAFGKAYVIAKDLESRGMFGTDFMDALDDIALETGTESGQRAHASGGPSDDQDA